MSESMSNTLKKPAAPTGYGLAPKEYGASLRKSFDQEFLRRAREEHERRQRLQMAQRQS
ncbi:hypothetical protein B1400_1282 [Bifidobacterium italicum]|uniref:Uncharacterized protein n=1 Tax=Bifidobacterium italicum TaxID=1960968 RepID=A0A2A2EHE7_9BIFI|nr:hypothetical protein B1400_1282 [Bifidobacterium italicum]